MLKKILRVLAVGFVGVALVLAALYQFAGLRPGFDGTGLMPRFASTGPDYDVLEADRPRILPRLRHILADPAHGVALREDLRKGLHTLPTWMQSVVRELIEARTPARLGARRSASRQAARSRAKPRSHA